jgi:uncharacterized protein YjiS (DUF1127 family)
MAHTQTSAESRASSRQLPGVAANAVATMAAVMTAWQRSVASRSAIAALTADQLKDIGYREEPRATLEIKPGLVTNLMSMR